MQVSQHVYGRTGPLRYDRCRLQIRCISSYFVSRFIKHFNFGFNLGETQEDTHRVVAHPAQKLIPYLNISEKRRMTVKHPSRKQHNRSPAEAIWRMLVNEKHPLVFIFN